MEFSCVKALLFYLIHSTISKTATFNSGRSEKIVKALDISLNQLYGGSQFHQITIQLTIARNLRKYREEAELSIEDFNQYVKHHARRSTGFGKGKGDPLPRSDGGILPDFEYS